MWVDLASLRQCLKDFDVVKTRKLIKDIGCTLVEMDDVLGFLGRSFCAFEIFSTVDGQAKFLPILDLVRANHMEVLLKAHPVNVEEAKTRNGRSNPCLYLSNLAAPHVMDVQGLWALRCTFQLLLRNLTLYQTLCYIPTTETATDSPTTPHPHSFLGGLKFNFS